MRWQDALRESWESLSPKAKRRTAIGGAVGLLLLVVWLLMPAQDRQPRARHADDVQRVRLSDRDTREVSIDALAAQLASLEAENARLNRDVERLRNESGRRGRADTGMDEATERELHALRQANMDMQRQVRELNQRVERQIGRGRPEAEDRQGDEIFDTAEPAGDALSGASVGGSILPPITDTPARSSRDNVGGQIRVITSAEREGDQASARSESEGAAIGAHLPAGSIISGVLITGMDAPTGQAGRRDPFPALLRVKAEAVLPNRFRADIRECFILMSGHGDLSSERAYLRGETLSCVREDGAAIESSLRGYAVGSDGKAGIRGRVVSKQGTLLARSAMAGFMEGLSNAFNLTNVPVISTDPNDRIQWQRRMSGDSLQAATLTGAGRALDRIAQYYLEMAEGMYPVIEIDAGREIEFVLNGGLRLQAARRAVERNDNG